MKRALIPTTLACLAGPAALATSQELLFEFTGLDHDDNLGISVAGAGDVDGDGWPDVLLGSTALGGTGYAYLVSGRTGSFTVLTSGVPFDLFGSAVSGVGDVDMDGYADFAVGARFADGGGESAGNVRVFSGRTGGTLFSVDGDPEEQLGHEVAAAGDVNDDGFPDWMAAAALPFSAGPDYVRVYSGDDATVLHTFFGDDALDSFGAAVDGAGDVDGDGYDDLVVGAYQPLVTEEGYARVYSGLDGSELYTWHGDAPMDDFGFSVAGAGDTNGDGYADVVVGAIGPPGYVRLFSGVDGSLLHEWTSGVGNDEFGTSVDGAGDVNADGYADVIVGMRTGHGAGFGSFSGQARIFSGQSGVILATIDGAQAHERLGTSVAGVGDIDLDGYADVVLGAPLHDVLGPPTDFDAGAAYVYSGFVDCNGNGTTDDADIASGASDDCNANGIPDDCEIAGADCNGNGTLDECDLASGASQDYDESGVPDECECLGVPYCTSGPSSVGPGAVFAVQGSTSVSANDLRLIATGCPPFQNGIFIYAAGQAEIPFGGGFLCVSGQIFRLPIVGTGPAGTPSWQLDNTNPPQPAAQISVGSTWNFQFWYRDPGAGPPGFNLSDAMAVTFCP